MSISGESERRDEASPDLAALKQRCLNDLREDLDKADFGVNKDFKELLQSMVNNPAKVLTIDDEINFDNEICLTLCNGKCCSNVHLVRISPVEVDAILESDGYKSVDQFQFVKDNFRIFLGQESLIPMATIKFRKRGKTTTCPFLREVKKEAYGIDNEARVRRLYVGTQGLCSIQQDKKPIVCMLFPLGRVDIPKENTALFYCRDCPGTHTAKKIKIRDIAGGYEELHRKREEYHEAMQTIIKDLRSVLSDQILKEVLHTIMLVLFLGDGTTQEKMKEIRTTATNVLRRIEELPRQPVKSESEVEDKPVATQGRETN